MRRLAVAVVVAALAASACGSGGGAGRVTPSSTPTVSRISSTGKLSILEPQPEATVKGPQVKVRLSLTGARIIPQTTQKIRPDEGHIHLRLDGQTITLLGDLSQTLQHVSPGTHLMEAEFVAGDHTPFTPRVIATVSFTAE